MLGSALPGGAVANGAAVAGGADSGPSAVADGTAVAVAVADGTAVAVAGGASGLEDGAHGLDGSKPFALPVRIEVAGLTAEQAVEQ